MAVSNLYSKHQHKMANVCSDMFTDRIKFARNTQITSAYTAKQRFSREIEKNIYYLFCAMVPKMAQKHINYKNDETQEMCSISNLKKVSTVTKMVMAKTNTMKLVCKP